MLYPHLISDGRPGNEGSGRITGGTEAEPNSRPYIVTLGICTCGAGAGCGCGICGGTLIGKFQSFLFKLNLLWLGS